MVSMRGVRDLLYRGVGSIRTKRGYLSIHHYDDNESGEVQDGDAGVVSQHSLNPSHEFVVSHAELTRTNGTPAPTGVNLVFIIFDEAGDAALTEVVLEGDDNYFTREEMGDNPDSDVMRYENTSDDIQYVGLAVDNGEFDGEMPGYSSGTGQTEDITVSVKTRQEATLTEVDQ